MKRIMTNLIVCWAEKVDKDFLENSFNINWGFEYVNDFKELGNMIQKGSSKMVLIKLEKSNVLNIIRQKKKLQALQDHFQIPITFLVAYGNLLYDYAYQILVVDDTEILNVNSKNIQRVVQNLIDDKFRINRSIYNDKSSNLDGRSYQFAV